MPEAYVAFVDNLLLGWRTKLKFDNYMSDWFDLDNGISQGDLLSMLLYLFYNANHLDVASGLDKLSLGYVDDVALIVTADNFTQTHRMLKNIMLCTKAGFHWAKAHNSRFETSKSVLVDFSQSKSIEWPSLVLWDSTVMPSSSHKFIRVMVDQELCW